MWTKQIKRKKKAELDSQKANYDFAVYLGKNILG